MRKAAVIFPCGNTDYADYVVPYVRHVFEKKKLGDRIYYPESVSKERYYRDFEEFIEKMCESDILVVIYDGCDPDCMFSAGYAYAVSREGVKNIEILVVLLEWVRDSVKEMLKSVADKVYYSIDEMAEDVEDIIKFGDDSLYMKVKRRMQEQKRKELQSRSREEGGLGSREPCSPDNEE